MFDPPHIGHLVLACEARWQLDLDEVWFVPTARPPHRAGGWLAPELRYRMACATVEGHPGLAVSRVELERPGTNFMVDTLDQIARERGSGTELWLLIGADQLVTFDRWREPERILRLARLGVVRRSEVDPAGFDAAAAARADRIDHLTMPTIAVSSSLIRERIEHHQPVRHLVSPGVSAILDDERLTEPPTALP